MSKAAPPPSASHPPPPYFPSAQRSLTRSPKPSSPFKFSFGAPGRQSPKPRAQPTGGGQAKELALAKVVAHLATTRRVEIVQVDAESDNAWPLPVPCHPDELPLGENSVKRGKRKEPTLEEVARLCSQHHQSAYSCSKWGQQGSPNRYHPLSVVAPDHTAEIMSSQAKLEISLLENDGIVYASRNPSPSSSSSSSMSMSDASSIIEPASLTNSQHSHGVFTAEPANMSTVSLALTEPEPEDDRSVGTQSSLWTVDSDVVWFDARTATDMDVDEQPSAMATSLGAFTATRDFAAEEGLEGVPCGPCAGDKRTAVAVSEWEQEEEKRRRIKEAMDEPLVRAKELDVQAVATTNAAPLRHPVKTSATHPINISPFLPLEVLPVVTAACVPLQDGSLITTPRSSNLDVSGLILSQPAQYPYKLPAIGEDPSPHHQLEELQRQRRPAELGVAVGNLLLSSCPGKKVRLAGPVKGRGAICRDLATDLQRIRSEGVGCIVWFV
jgi:hypothetical protein